MRQHVLPHHHSVVVVAPPIIFKGHRRVVTAFILGVFLVASVDEKEAGRLRAQGSTSSWLPTVTPSSHLHYRPVDLKYAAHHMYINREHKLVYCAVPKVACTEFMGTTTTAAGECPSQSAKVRVHSRWRGDPHFRHDKPLFSHLSPKEATEIFNDPNWTKFVFFRDPAERLLSAFIDKFENGARYGVSYSMGIYKRRRMNFSDFVDIIAQPGPDGPRKRSDNTGLHAWTNPHWRPQRFMCNIERFLPAYNFVGSFSKLKDHTERLLRAKGLWDEYGSRGWLPVERRRRQAKPHTAGMSIFDRNNAWHKAPQRNAMKNYWTDRLLDRVRAAYQMDYDMFAAINFTFDGDPVTGAAWETVSHQRLLCSSAREFRPC